MESSDESSNDRHTLLRFFSSVHRSGEENSDSTVSNSVGRLQLLNYLLQRVRNNIGESYEEDTPLERRLRRRRLNYLDDEESQCEIENESQKENYDFRTYPLNINWKDIYSTDNDSCNINDNLLDEIIEENGYIGVYFYLEFCEKIPKFKTLPENFIFNICDYYKKNTEKNDPDSFNKANFMIEIFYSKIKAIEEIIKSQYLTSKEIVFIKIVFDILIHYFTHIDKLSYLKLKNEVLPASLMFYSSLSNEDIILMNDKFRSLKNTKEILSKNTLSNKIVNFLKGKISDKKSKYLRHLLKIKNSYDMIYKGIELSKFVV